MLTLLGGHSCPEARAWEGLFLSFAVHLAGFVHLTVILWGATASHPTDRSLGQVLAQMLVNLG